MLLHILTKSKKIVCLLGVLLMAGITQPLWAAGPPGPSLFDNPLAITLIVLMILLLIIIGILAGLLIGAADLKLKKGKKQAVAGAMAVLLLIVSNAGIAQGAADAANTTTTTASTIAGMSTSTFYVMASVIFLELLIILVLLVNIRFLIKAEKNKLAEPVVETAEAVEAKKNRLSWWDRFNSLRPVAQESELDLGHEYDGIRELNNRLPPWWIYGFYLTIIFAAVYLWRFHISHTGPSSKEEYETSVAKAELQVKEYLKLKGDNVDENTVTLLTDAADIEAGKAIFTNPMNCVPCHGPDANGLVAGNPGVGPNLTDDFWLYGGNIKDLFKTIKYGTNKGMRSWKDDLSAKQIAQVASYVKSIHGTKPKGKEPQGELYKDDGAATPAADTLKAKENKVALN